MVDGADLPAEMGTDASLLKQLRAAECAALEGTIDAGERDWSYLGDLADIPRCARQLFWKTGKPQDGFVSRFLNRPLSRGLSRLLVHLPVSPNQWTIVFMLLPLAGALFVMRGESLGFAIGAVFFQLHSALDGCDGEVARVKYQETASGKKLDAVCDRLSTLLFAISLGIGLFRQHGNAGEAAWIYLVEGVSAAVLIGVAETWLTRKDIDDDLRTDGDSYGSYVSENRQSFNEGDQLKLWMIRHSGMLAFGDGAARFFGELTKRDVFNFVFMVLALCGHAQWVLHILAVCACAIVAFAVKEMLKRIVDANSAA